MGWEGEISGILGWCLKRGKVWGNENEIYGIEEGYWGYCEKIVVSREEGMVCREEVVLLEVDVVNVRGEFFDVGMI